ncbi:MAG: vitamin B12-dependent ribonucleotide reductase [Thermodesulfobacteriota bacterium]
MQLPDDLPALALSANAELVLRKRYVRKGPQGEEMETPQELFWRVASAIAEVEGAYPHSPYAKEVLARRFYDLMATGSFFPNSPTLMNAGTELGQLAACFVLPVGDSMEEIFDAIKYAALIHKSGGGTGFAFSRLRAASSRVGSTGGVASGPVSFLRIFNTATEQVKQGGTRRGANMGILRVDHPDILEFIRVKEREGELNNFNLSVALTEDFMHRVEADTDYPLIAPQSGKEVGRLRAREVFSLLVQKAWESGDPGIIFLDRINRDNPTPHLGEIEATNPCGEQPLLPYEACNLGSVNLSRFADVAQQSLDWEGLQATVHLAVRFLDNVIDASTYPLSQITQQVQTNRKIGLGIMGWADLLYQLRIGYDSRQALSLGEAVMDFIHKESRAASKQLAKERGPFPAYGESVYASHDLGPYRNATTTTIAPTGTLSILAGCSSGIEPLFALSFVREVMDGERLVETNPYIQEALEAAGCASKRLLEEVARRGTVRDMDLVPEEVRRVFVTAMDIDGEAHLRMQAAFQKYTDNAVSKTVNLAHDASEDDIRHIYWLAYELGCKGVTVYRDGCKSVQVLSTEERRTQQGTEANGTAPVRQRPDVVYGFTQKVKTGLGELYLTVNEVDGRPFEVFATIGRSGRSITAKAEAIGRLVSLALRSGVPVREVVKQLKGIGGEHPVFQKKGLLLSIPDAVGRVLEQRYLQQDLAVRDGEQGLKNNSCPECGEELVFQEGCLLCRACGYTKCE